MHAPRIAVLATLMLSACSPEPDTSTDAPQAPAAAPVTSTSGAPTASLWNGGELRPLDIQVAHANGAVLQLTSLQSRATDTAVGVRIINGRERDVDLNRFSANRNGYLLLDSGERLYLSPPATNSRLTVPAGQSFEGELVFLGRLPPVSAAVLVLNENMSVDNEHTSTPGFRIDLPLSGSTGR